MKFQGFVGPTYNLNSVNVDCQRCVNLYPKVIESGTGKEGQSVYLTTTPGLEKLTEIGDGPIRLIYVDRPVLASYSPNNRIFVVSGSEVFKASYISGAWVVAKIGDLDSESGPVNATSFQINMGTPPTTAMGTQVLFADGASTYGYFILYNPSVPHDMNEGFANLNVDPEFPIASHVVWIDGYTIINRINSNQFFVSQLGTLTFDPLDYASAEGSPDSIVALLAMNRDLWIFNEQSIEIWSNTGNSSFPFERMQGGFIEKGCVAPHSVAKIDGLAFWIGQDESGQGVIYCASGMNPTRISNYSVEEAMSGYASIKDARAFTYQQGGVSFYVVNFGEATWVYDLNTKMWHERAFTNEGALERHRADNHAFWPHLKTHLVGDYSSNAIYALKEDVYTDDGNAITRMRVAPHVSSQRKNVFFSRMDLDIETGVGLDGSVQGSDPQIMLSWSNDGGHTWSSEVWGSLGKKIGGIGSFKTRVFWNRLGMSRDRVFKLVITDPVKVKILGAELELESGTR